jgi:hypothetical protein
MVRGEPSTRYSTAGDDPEFAAKAGRVLDLYPRERQGKALNLNLKDDEFVALPTKKPAFRPVAANMQNRHVSAKKFPRMGSCETHAPDSLDPAHRREQVRK